MHPLDAMKFWIGAIFTLVLLAACALVAIYAGWYDIAASSPHTAFGRWLFSTTMHNSVARLASDAPRPPDGLASRQRIARGAHEFDEHCSMCHGAPDRERGDVGKGLRPEPPDLAKAAHHWSDREIYWIVAHGIKMTGMPAWGETMKPGEIWDIVAFVSRLPEVKPEEYRNLVQAGEQGEERKQTGR